MKIKSRSWEIKSDNPIEIEIKGTGEGLVGGRTQTITVNLSSLTLTETTGDDGRKTYLGYFEALAENRLDRVGQNFKIILRSREGDAPPFKELNGCTMLGLSNGTRPPFVPTEVIWE